MFWCITVFHICYFPTWFFENRRSVLVCNASHLDYSLLLHLHLFWKFPGSIPIVIENTGVYWSEVKHDAQKANINTTVILLSEFVEPVTYYRYNVCLKETNENLSIKNMVLENLFDFFVEIKLFLVLLWVFEPTLSYI